MVGCFTDLAQHLGPDQPVYGIQARGFDGLQPPCTSIEEMATCYREAIQKAQPQGPYLLAGWSMGGLIAYEIARQLEQQGQEIAFLGLLDTSVFTDSTQPFENPSVIEVISHMAGQPIPHLDQILSEADDEEDAILKAFAMAQQAELMPRNVSLADIQRYVEITNTNYRAARAYRPQPYPGTAILFSSQEHDAADIEIEADINRWRALVHTLKLHKVPGSHEKMVFPPYVEHLGAAMSIYLGKEN